MTLHRRHHVNVMLSNIISLSAPDWAARRIEREGERQLVTHTHTPQYYFAVHCKWRGGVTGRAYYLRSTGVGSNPTRGKAAYQPWASCSPLCASVTKQYNLIPAKGR